MHRPQFFTWTTHTAENTTLLDYRSSTLISGVDPGGAPGARAPLTTKNEAPAPKFYKTEAPEWQF